jgi:indole-3-acetate monooxygenase
MYNKEPLHPSHFVPSVLADEIRSVSDEAERSGMLHLQQLSIIYQEKWFKLYVPKAFGGLELSLPDGIRIQEGLAWADGSMGWVVTLCSGASWFIGFLALTEIPDLFRNELLCFAGSGQASGIAKHTGSGYEVTGYWDNASGAPHATAFTANCLIEKDGIILYQEDSSPLVQAFIFLREEVIIHKNWNAIGMIATASHSFEVKRLKVTADRRFIIEPAHAILHGPIYQFPFLQFAEATLAANSSGLAVRFLDLCGVLFKEKAKHKNEKEKFILSSLLEEATTELQGLRQSFYTTVQDSWDAIVKDKIIPPSLLRMVSKSSQLLASRGRHWVDTLYPYCGLIAANPETEINRVWRDLHTASQHSLLVFSGD